MRLACRFLIGTLVGGLAVGLILVSLAAVFPLRFESSITRWTDAHGQLDAWLVAAVIHAESRFRADAISPAGARGLMQIMPATGSWIAEQISVEGPIDFDDPDTNIRFGTWYLAYLLERYDGDITNTLAAYNAGPSAVDRWTSAGETPYAETSTYVSRVLSRRRVYSLLYGTPVLGSLLRAVMTFL